MPIYKVGNYPMTAPRLSSSGGPPDDVKSGGGVTVVSGTADHGTDVSARSYSELPESERYDQQTATGKHLVVETNNNNIDIGPEDGDGAESFIDREIREHREREKELAAMHRTMLLSAGGSSDGRSSDHPQPTATLTTHVVVASTSSAPAPPPPPSVPHDSQRRDDEDDRTSRGGGGAAKGEEDEVDRAVAGRTFSHPGESLIVRELLEQQKREDELRQHWKQMGFELTEPERVDLDLDEDDGAFVQPHQQQQQQVRPEAATAAAVAAVGGQTATVHAQQKVEASRTAAVRAAAAASSPSPPLSPPQHQLPPLQQSSLSPTISGQHSKETSGHSGADPTPTTPRTSVTRKILLPPESADPDDADASKQLLYQPQSESVLEREIRAARERERALRNSRGLPDTTHEEARRSISVEIEIVKHLDVTDSGTGGAPAAAAATVSKAEKPGGPQAADNQHDDFTKRYAESRLKAELQRERQRELDLRHLGVIQTISEDCISQQQPSRMFETAEATAEKSCRPSWTADVVDLRQARQLQRQSGQQQLQSPPAAPGTIVAAATTAEKNPAAAVKLPPATAPVKTSPSEHPGWSTAQKRELPLVLRTYPYGTAAESQSLVTADTLMTTTRASRGSIIEEEIAEFKKREEELRLLRESLNLTRVDDADKKDAHHGPVTGTD
jgi:hypothetical protein